MAFASRTLSSAEKKYAHAATQGKTSDSVIMATHTATAGLLLRY